MRGAKRRRHTSSSVSLLHIDSLSRRRNLDPGCSFAAYVAGVNGMGYGEYSDMSDVVSTKARTSKKAPVSANRSSAPISASSAPAPASSEKKVFKKVKKKTDAPVPAPLTATSPAPLSAKKTRTLQPVVAGEAGKVRATSLLPTPPPFLTS